MTGQNPNDTFERIAIRQLKAAGAIGIMVGELQTPGDNLERREILLDLEQQGLVVFNRISDRYVWHENAGKLGKKKVTA